VKLAGGRDGCNMLFFCLLPCQGIGIPLPEARLVFGMIILVLLAPLSAEAEVANLVWEKTYRFWGCCRPLAAVAEPDGGLIVIIHNHKNSRPFRDQVLLLRLDPDGDTISKRKIKLGGLSRIVAARVAGGGLVLAGEYQHRSAVLVAQVDGRGRTVWNQIYDATAGEAWRETNDEKHTVEVQGVLPTDDGGFVFGGTVSSRDWPCGSAAESGTLSCPKSSRMYLFKTDCRGSAAWHRLYEPPVGVVSESMSSLVRCGDGNFVLLIQRYRASGQAGAVIKVDGDGHIVWEREVPNWSGAYLIDQCLDGGFLLAGRVESQQAGGTPLGNAWIARIDEGGNLVWEREFPSRQDDYPTMISSTEDGGSLVSMLSFNPLTREGTARIVKLDQRGKEVFEIDRFLTGREVSADLFHLSEQGELYVVGRLCGPYCVDAYVARIDLVAADSSIHLSASAGRARGAILGADGLPPMSEYYLSLVPIGHGSGNAEPLRRQVQTDERGRIGFQLMATQEHGLYMTFIDLDGDGIRDISEPVCWFLDLPQTPHVAIALAIVLICLPVILVYYTRSRRTSILNPRRRAENRAVVLGVCLLISSAYLTAVGICKMGMATKLAEIGPTVGVIQGGRMLSVYDAMVRLTRHVTQFGGIPRGLETLRWLLIPSISWGLFLFLLGISCAVLGLKVDLSRLGGALKAGLLVLGCLITLFMLSATFSPYQLFQRGWVFWALLFSAVFGISLTAYGYAASRAASRIGM